MAAPYAKAPTGSEKSNFWLVTYNDPHQCAAARQWIRGFDGSTRLPTGYKVWGQEEEAPSTGHSHLQLLFQVPGRLLRKDLQAVLPGKPDYRPVWTTPSKAYKYVTREEKRKPGGWHYESAPPPEDSDLDIDPRAQKRAATKFTLVSGESPSHSSSDGRGARSDLDRVKEWIEGQDPKHLCYKLLQQRFPEHDLARPAWLKRMLCAYAPQRDEATVGIFVWGDTGVGKSTALKQMVPDAYWLPLADGGQQWFDDYDLEEDMIIDEYFPKAFSEMVLKRMMDHQPWSVQVKHGHLPFVSKRVIFCSNFSFDECFPGGTVSGDAVRRRFSHCLHFVPDGDGGTQVVHQPLPDTGVAAPRNLAHLGALLDNALLRPSPRYTPRPRGQQRSIGEYALNDGPGGALRAAAQAEIQAEITCHQPEVYSLSDDDE